VYQKLSIMALFPGEEPFYPPERSSRLSFAFYSSFPATLKSTIEPE
jgi:hypothetical protein